MEIRKLKLPFKKSLSSGSIAGLNIGSSSIKVVKLSRGNRNFLLEKFVVEQIAEEPAKGEKAEEVLNEALKHAVEKAEIANTEVVTGISGPAVVVRYIDLPQMSKGDLEKAVKFEAKPHIPFDLKDVILDFQVLELGRSEEGKKMKILLVAAQRDFISKHIELLEKQSLRPLIIDVDSFALVNAFLYANQEEMTQHEAIALVNLGASITNVSILNKGIPLFTRDIPMGGNNLTESISKRLNITFSQAERLKMNIEDENSPPFEIISVVLETLANEIRRSFDYYESQITATEKVSFKVFLSGGTAKLKGVDSFLSKILDLPVSFWDPVKKFEVNRDRFPEDNLKESLPHLCVGVGLALRGGDIL